MKINFTLIICTYKRAKPLLDLLNSVAKQTLYPTEILIIDGSQDDETKIILEKNYFKNLSYFLVDSEYRGLTRQRNFGISKVCKNSEIVCFLDDDTILEHDFFENLLNTYSIYPDAIGVGGYITNEVFWKKVTKQFKIPTNQFYFDGFVRKEPSRFVIRKKLGLNANVPPGFIPEFSHGRSVGFLPPSGKIYPVQQFMGGVSSFKIEAFTQISFSNYFEGYGLYEDADFTSRLSKIGNLYVNTNAKLAHFHNHSGRPNMYIYGKMIVRNGWYVWRSYNKNPKLSVKLKWNAISIILIIIRFSSIFTSKNKKVTFMETFGRISGMYSLLFNNPRIKNSSK